VPEPGLRAMTTRPTANLRLTHKVRRKTVTEALRAPATVRKAEQEIA